MEEIFFPGDPVPLYLDKTSETLRLIQHMRNEAHRFSLLFHRQKRSSGFAKSILESVPGLGPKTIEKLYQHYKTYNSIVSAELSDLNVLIGSSKAKLLKKYISGPDLSKKDGNS